jgi:hypothetical protein
MTQYRYKLSAREKRTLAPSPMLQEALRDAKMAEFTHDGRTYRTNSDASIVEGKDGSKWNRTGSLPIVLAARKAANV